MASKQDVQTLVDQIKQYRADYDTRWLQWYLGSLKGDQQQAAFDDIKNRIDTGDLGSTVQDLNVGVHYAVDQKLAQSKLHSDPTSRLAGASHVALSPLEDHTPWHPDQIASLKGWFKTDKFLKNNLDAQNQIVDELLKNAGGGDLLSKAKEINQNQRTPEQKAQYYGKKADSLAFLTDDKVAQENGITIPNNAFTDQDHPPKPLNVSGLQKYLDTLDSVTRVAVVENIKKWAKDNSRWSPLQESDLTKMVNSAHQYASDSYGNQYYDEKDPAKKQQLLAQAEKNLLPGQQLTRTELRPIAKEAAGKDPTAAGQSPQAAFGVPQGAGADWKPSRDQTDLWKAVTGQDFEQAYQSFAQNYAMAVQQRDAQGNAYGQEKLWTAGGANLQGAWRFQQPIKKSELGATGNTNYKKGTDYTPSRAQFAQMQATYQYKIASAVEYEAKSFWANKFPDIPWPADLSTKIYQKIASMPIDKLMVFQGQANDSAQGKSSSGLVSTDPMTGSAVFDSLIQDEVNLHPEWTKASTDKAAADRFVQSYTSKIGHAPSAAEIKQATGADETTQLNIINSVKMPNGLTYGTYSSASQRLNPLWQQYYGKQASPDQLAWSVGRTDEDIKDYIYNSESRVKGLKIGQYEGYQKFLDDVSGGLWGTGSNDAMIQALHQHMSSK